MAVGSQAKKDQIKLRRQGGISKTVANGLFIGLGCFLRWVDTCRDLIDIRWRYWDMPEQPFLCHAVIAFWIVQRYVALIGPEKVNRIPVDSPTPAGRSEQLI